MNKNLYFVLSSIFAIAILTTKMFQIELAYNILIPIFVGMAAYWCFLKSENKSIKGNLLLILALFVAFIADTLNNWVEPAIIGLGFFLGTQMLLIAFFFKKKKFENKDLIKLIPFLGWAVIFCIKFVPQFSSLLYYIGIPCYVALVTCMLWRAMCLYKIDTDDDQFAMLGGLCFFVCDISVVSSLVFGNLPVIDLVVWIVYPPALFLLSLIDNKKELK